MSYLLLPIICQAELARSAAELVSKIIADNWNISLEGTECLDHFIHLVVAMLHSKCILSEHNGAMEFSLDWLLSLICALLQNFEPNGLFQFTSIHSLSRVSQLISCCFNNRYFSSFYLHSPFGSFILNECSQVIEFNVV